MRYAVAALALSEHKIACIQKVRLLTWFSENEQVNIAQKAVLARLKLASRASSAEHLYSK